MEVRCKGVITGVPLAVGMEELKRTLKKEE